MQEPQAEAKKPAVPIKKSVTPDYLICLDDGKRFKSLKRHLRTRYDMSPDAYRQKWGLPSDYPMVAPNYAQTRSNLAKQMGLGQGRRQVAAPVEVVPKEPVRKRGRKKAEPPVGLLFIPFHGPGRAFRECGNGSPRVIPNSPERLQGVVCQHRSIFHGGVEVDRHVRPDLPQIEVEPRGAFSLHDDPKIPLVRLGPELGAREIVVQCSTQGAPSPNEIARGTRDKLKLQFQSSFSGLSRGHNRERPNPNTLCSAPNILLEVPGFCLLTHEEAEAGDPVVPVLPQSSFARRRIGKCRHFAGDPTQPAADQSHLARANPLGERTN
jgi:hypothetical protein